MKSSAVLTGNRSQHVGDQDLHQGLVEDVIAAPHPQPDRLIFTQRHQLLCGNHTFRFIITTHTHTHIFKNNVRLTNKTVACNSSEKAVITDMTSQGHLMPSRQTLKPFFPFFFLTCWEGLCFHH